MKKIIIYAISLLAFNVQAQNNSYITKVLEYVPAPGQFVHLIPAYASGDDASSMCTKCLNNFNSSSLVSLGAYGGYITVGFDHTIANVQGEYDIKVLGNAFEGSAEPGIILVSADTNKDGLPNDEWYELKGSEFDNATTSHNYEITYYKPANSTDKVQWTDNQNGSGYVQRTIRTQAYYPQWINAETMTFKGSRLPDVGVYNSSLSKWVMTAYDFGYADNQPNDSDGCKLKFDWAVDKNGNSVTVKGVDFIRIYTAVNQAIGGGVGEVSTEVSGVEDLHPAQNGESTILTSISSINKASDVYYSNGEITIQKEDPCKVCVYNSQGALINQWNHEGGLQNISFAPSKGLYIIQTGFERYKIIVQ